MFSPFYRTCLLLCIPTQISFNINRINTWIKIWRIKLNESQSNHINFTNNKVNPVSTELNVHVIPYENTAKYLGMTLDNKLT